MKILFNIKNALVRKNKERARKLRYFNLTITTGRNKLFWKL